MAQHDYKPRRRKPGGRTSRKSGTSGWAWLLVGLAIGAFGGFLFYLSKRPSPAHHVFSLSAASKKPARTHAKSSGTTAANSKATVTPEKPKFDFYTLLPKLQVDVPPPPHSLSQDQRQAGTSAKSVSPGPDHPATADKVKAPGKYMLQLASFGTAGQANVLKAKLAFQGIVANVSPAKVRNYTWYRVQVGPFSNLDKLNAMMAHLEKEHIKPLLIKMNS